MLATRDCHENFENDLFASEDLRRIDYLPTPEDITNACASIRAQWTLNEKRRRFVGDLMSDEPDACWLPPVIDMSHFRLATGHGIESGL